jgi:hypothetical protein
MATDTVTTNVHHEGRQEHEVEKLFKESNSESFVNFVFFV